MKCEAEAAWRRLAWQPMKNHRNDYKKLLTSSYENFKAILKSFDKIMERLHAENKKTVEFQCPFLGEASVQTELAEEFSIIEKKFASHALYDACLHGAGMILDDFPGASSGSLGAQIRVCLCMPSRYVIQPACFQLLVQERDKGP